MDWRCSFRHPSSQFFPHPSSYSNCFNYFKLHMPQSFSPIPSPQPSVMLLRSFSRFSSGCRSLATRKNLLRSKHRTRSSVNFLKIFSILDHPATLLMGCKRGLIFIYIYIYKTQHFHKTSPPKIISQRAWPSLDSRHTEHLTVSPRCEVASVTSAEFLLNISGYFYDMLWYAMSQFCLYSFWKKII